MIEHCNLLLANELSNKIKNKTYLLQFLPEVFEKLISQKYINYGDKKLKTDYLIDIVNSLISKYYYKKKNKFILNATILKKKYGSIYSHYIKYLVENNILILRKNYRSGNHSRIYSINEDLLSSKITRYKNKDSVLLKKYKKEIFRFQDDESENKILDDVKIKLISDLYDIDIDIERSIFFLNSVSDSDMNIYNKNEYSVHSIKHKHIFYHFDKYGRMHTNYTILKSFIRKNCLLINGETTAEIDIPNSQPLFLSKLMNESNFKFESEELNVFNKLTRDGTFYDFLKLKLGFNKRSDAKKFTYKILFGRTVDDQNNKMFRALFPSIANFIKDYKNKHNDYKVISHVLQEMESNLIFNKIVNKLMTLYPEIKILTIHDSIIVPLSYKKIAEKIFYSELEKEINFDIMENVNVKEKEEYEEVT